MRKARTPENENADEMIEPLRIALAWPSDAATPLVGAFVRVVRELVHPDPRGAL